MGRPSRSDHSLTFLQGLAGLSPAGSPRTVQCQKGQGVDEPLPHLAFLGRITHPDEAPYAFVHLPKLLAQRSNPKSCTLQFVSNPDLGKLEVANESVRHNGRANTAVVIIFLL